MKHFWYDQIRLLSSLQIKHHNEDQDKLKAKELLLLKIPVT